MLISVIVPVYNAEKFLKRCIESVIKQSYENIELILINDGSTDYSGIICDNYACTDHRVITITQKNKGPAAARNAGIRSATGEAVFFLDADDFIEYNAIEILVKAYKQHQADLVMGNFGKLENHGEIIKQKVSFNLNNKPFDHQIKELSKSDIETYVRHFLKHPSNHLISYCWGRLYKLSIVRENAIWANEKMRLFEDFVFNLECLKKSNKVVFVNKCLYIYTMHNSHLSASMNILNAESLVHDMNIFKARASEFSRSVKSYGMNLIDFQKDIGHALIHYAIIFFVRSCRLVNRQNHKNIYNEIEKLIASPVFRDCLQYYKPSKGNSRILPILTKLKFIELIIIYCRHKAYKRYGRPI
jgi:glycosyltransferase involved in cell wall biosynthesis